MPPRNATDESSCSTCRCGWRLPLLLLGVLLAIVAYRAWQPAESPGNSEPTHVAGQPAGASSPREQGVTLTVDFGDGDRREFPAVAWKQGMTVADMMAQLPLRIVQKGSGAAAFLVSINSRANAEVESRYWTYEVNGRAGDRSFAVCELQPGDRILWSFGSRR